jgi:hypothetical protein
MHSDLEPATALPNFSAIAEQSAASDRHAADYANYHRLILAIAAAIVLAACVLQVRADQRVAVSLLTRWPLPEVCQSKILFGLDCPGCGLTRSFVHLAHGNVPASLAVHPLGWLVALFVVAQFPYRAWALKTHSPAPLGERTPWIITGVLFALLFATWLARLAL